MRSKLSPVILSTLVAMVSIPLCAQQRAKQSWDNLNQLQTGQKIQVVQMDMKSLKGRFLGFNRGSDHPKGQEKPAFRATN